MKQNSFRHSFFYILVFSIALSFGCSRTGRQLKHEKELANGRNEAAHESQTVVPESNTPTTQVPEFPTEKGSIPDRSVQKESLAVLYPKLSKAVFTIYNSDDEFEYQGSGFFISSTGIAVSNYHVFEGKYKNKSKIALKNHQQYTVGKIIETNKEYDYIIFQISGSFSKFPYLTIAEYSPKIGEKVFAIGNPKGLESTLSNGIISGRRDILLGDNAYIQINAEITHGSSGGALFNEYGEVIGITTSGFDEANLNFAVDIQILKLYRFIDN